MTPEEIRNIFSGARNALNAGKITKEEHDTILRHYYGTTNEQEAIDKHADSHHEKTIAITMGLLLLLSIGLFWDGGITGMAIFNDANQPLTNITSITVTGTMYGDGNATIWLDTTNGSLLIGTIHSDTGQPMTDKPSYTQGELVSIINAPENATYYFDDNITSVPTDVPFNATINGTLLIVTASETYRLPILIGDAQRTTPFTNLCIATCTIEPTNGTIRIETAGTTVDITGIEAGTTNRPPAQTAALPQLTINETATMNLSQHFTDPDGDTLLYSTSSSAISDLTVSEGILTITPIATGNETLTIYASDLTELISGALELTVIMPNVENVTDETDETNVTLNETGPINWSDIPANETVNETNLSVNGTDSTIDTNATLNTSNTTMNQTISCDDPDPNKRPLECIQSGNSTYFRPEDIYIESKDGIVVGKLTPIGNMLLRGGIIERSTGAPGSRDWARGYEDMDGEFIPTVWIDSSTGDLHLRGSLTEANANIVFEQGLTALMNERGIILALIDARTGDLVVRGNVIPYRRSFE